MALPPVEEKSPEDSAIKRRRASYDLFRSSHIDGCAHHALLKTCGFTGHKPKPPLRGYGSGGRVYTLSNRRVAKISYPMRESSDTLLVEAYNVASLTLREVHFIPKLENVSSNGVETLAIFSDGGNDLYECFTKLGRRCPPKKAEIILTQALTCFTDIEALGVCHGDMKSKNTLWNGETCLINDWATMSKWGEKDLNFCSTITMRAPETLLLLETGNSKVDTFAVGSTLFEILVGEPLADLRPIARKIEDYTHDLAIIDILQLYEDRLGPMPQEVVDLSPYKKIFYTQQGQLKRIPQKYTLQRCDQALERVKQEAINQSAVEARRIKIAARYERIIPLVLSMLTLSSQKRPKCSELLAKVRSLPPY